MTKKIIATLMITLAASVAFPQTSTAPKSLASTLGVYAFPQKGQTPSEQSVAESECYSWAVTNVGSDPFELQKQAQQQAQQTQAATQQAATQSGAGTVGKEVVKTAAVGTLIGGISGNEGKGAAYGAAAGVIRGNRKKGQQQQAAAQSAQAQGQQVQASTAQQMDNFKKAFSVCLEGKGFMVKY
jgi:hypothetical protein